jgi:hypothetical protein
MEMEVTTNVQFDYESREFMSVPGRISEARSLHIRQNQWGFHFAGVPVFA